MSSPAFTAPVVGDARVYGACGFSRAPTAYVTAAEVVSRWAVVSTMAKRRRKCRALSARRGSTPPGPRYRQEAAALPPGGELSQRLACLPSCVGRSQGEGPIIRDREPDPAEG
jgi:hypothetical protein